MKNFIDDIRGKRSEECNNILKAFGKSEENEIEKGGEGSKGGHIIGHTQSGKPVYDTVNHPEHEEFNNDDHLNAAFLHQDLAKKAHGKMTYEEDTRKRRQLLKEAHQHDDAEMKHLHKMKLR